MAEPLALMALTEEIGGLIDRGEAQQHLSPAERLQLVVLWEAMKVCLADETQTSAAA
jgi:hypothetical protein